MPPPDHQRQKRRKPSRCQRITVSGLTMVNQDRPPGNQLYSQTKRNRLWLRK